MINKLQALDLARELPDRIFLDGDWRSPASEELIEVVDPATGKSVRTLTVASAADVGDAIGAARAAAPGWAATRPRRRAHLLRGLADRVEQHADQLAALDCLDNGKPVTLSRNVDIVQTAAHLRYQASIAESRHAETVEDAAGAARATLNREPVGTVGLITPWNYPTLMIGRALAPALAAGNSVVIKPSEQTPLSGLLLARLIADAGFPDGVVNIVNGSGPVAGQALAADARIDMLTFTGGHATAQKIRQRTEARTTFELGGKAPFIVRPDADLEQAVQAAVIGAFGNQGQNCMAASRLLVHRDVHADFSQLLTSRTDALQVGDGFDPQTECGPLISARHRDRVSATVDRARAAGIDVLVGGVSAGHAFFRPTVLAGAGRSAEVWTEEIFGPVTLIQPYATDEEAVALANDTRYGLAASVWTSDPVRADAIARQLRCGVVWINCYSRFDAAISFSPRAASGTGAVGGVQAYDTYTVLKSTWTLAGSATR